MTLILIPHDFMGRRPLGYCGICDVPFYSDRDRDRHLRSGVHAAQVEVERQAEQARREGMTWLYEHPDPEVQQHMEKVGQRMREEGRWVVKPNERAGFS